jgi:hypothetical protein
MMQKRNESESGIFDRRRFCTVAGVGAIASLMSAAHAEAATGAAGDNSDGEAQQTGNGEWTYRMAPE